MVDKPQPYQLGFTQAIASPEGRALIYELFRDAKLFDDPFTPDPMATAYNCGAQAVMRPWFDELMGQNPGAFALMLQENKDGRTDDTDRADEADD